MNNSFKLILIAWFICLQSTFAQTKVYTPSEAQNNIYKDVLHNPLVLPTNKSIEDFSFLEPIAIDNKVVLIGETHYSRDVSILKDQIIFTLNDIDYFPLLIIEEQYSKTPFYNHYINIQDETKANDFWDEELNNFIYTVEDSLFINKLRIWNLTHPDKNISIGCLDLEWSWDQVLEEIISPYFHSLSEINSTELNTILDIGYNQSDEFFTKIKPYIQKAETTKHIGKHEFIDHYYITNVIESIESTFKAMSISGWWEYFRQKEMVNRITSKSYYGSHFENEKVIMYGGGFHMKSKVNYGLGDNFISEGSYLNYELKETKGQVYSIMLNAMSYSLGTMHNKTLRNNVSMGTQYTRVLNKLQKAYSTDTINENDYCFLYGFRTELEKYIFSNSYKEQQSAISLSDNQWLEIKKVTADVNNEDFSFDLDEEYNYNKEYDLMIYIPFNTISQMRYNKIEKLN